MDKDKKRKLELLEELNAEFIKSLEKIIIPFFNNLNKIHLNNVELNKEEKDRIISAITLTNYFSKKEASIEESLYQYIKNGAEKVIVECITREVAKVQKIAIDAEKGKYDALYLDCQNLLDELINLEKKLDKIISGSAA